MISNFLTFQSQQLQFDAVSVATGNTFDYSKTQSDFGKQLMGSFRNTNTLQGKTLKAGRTASQDMIAEVINENASDLESLNDRIEMSVEYRN